ncbi:protein kinase C-binding protein 1-like [Bradysia coprophila]|uniref:protein kinase C-binding protein 1-like n=1 Tax=Bradysia coprophila TaxID=38358 RepID=UPI00187DA49E|nr:protein kinase C-binding protein 1-like [Bradysia coprophila]XP_037049729.1 protein kinase C-binding protein 1-like [Bradysia coprophila]
MKKMDTNILDVHDQLEEILKSSVTELKRNDQATADTATHTVIKQTNSRNSDISPSHENESLPTILYLKKVVHPAIQPKAAHPTNSVKEPIPKLIVSTKPIKLGSYITGARKAPVTVAENSDQSSVKPADPIKSTKIIIKGITSQDKRLVVCESPTTTEPLLVSPQSSPPVLSPRIVFESTKNESKESQNDNHHTKEPVQRMETPEPNASVPDASEESRPALSTPRANREMKQLQKTMKESKVITDCVALTDATRRIKRKLNETDGSEGTAAVTPPSDASQPKSDETNESAPKDTNHMTSISIRRNTRSLNAEFSAKQKKFLAGIQKHSRDSDEEHSDDERGRGRRKIRKSGKMFPPLKAGYDKYCWQCHQNDPVIACTHCKRTYHVDCLKTKQLPKTENQKLVWECPECVALETSIKDTEKARYDFNQLCTMLDFALQRLKSTSKSLVIPGDSDNIIHSVNFDSMEKKIINKQYQSTHSFLTDCRWILHNCTIYYSRNVKLLALAKSVFKIGKQEIYDIDTCHECYYNANTCKTDWFVEICSRPHILVWAKLKGFPYWPAKVMTTNLQGMVDVRFFGDHDRAFVPIRECYLYSKEHPNPITVKTKRQSISHSVVEVDKYIQKLTAKFGSFNYPEVKTLFDPFREEEQLEQMIPNYRSHANALVNKKCTSNSDLTYKIVKTADNNLSIFKKNDNNVQSPEGVHEKTQPADHKHAKSATIDALDDLKYQVMKRDRDASRAGDGRVDSVILKRKAGSPSFGEVVVENRKRMKLLPSSRRSSTPIPIDNSKNVAAKTIINRETQAPKASDDEQSKSSRSSETPSKDVLSKTSSKEDLISAVVKKLDTLQAFVSTNVQSNKKTDKELCNEISSSSDIVDQPMTVIPQPLELSETILDKGKSDEDENLLVPMQNIHGVSDSKKDLKTAASSRQGSMSGSSIQSVPGSLDDPYEMSIKAEPLSGDEMDNSAMNYDCAGRVKSPFNNPSQNGSQDSSFSKISVKNINSMTKPLDPMHQRQVAVRKFQTNKSILRPELVRQRSRKMLMSTKRQVPSMATSSITSNIQQLQQQQNSQLKQSQNMVCIPMDRSNFQRIESIMLNNVRGTTTAHVKTNPPPLTAVSSTPSLTVTPKDLISKPKNSIISAANSTISSVGPPPLSLTTAPIPRTEQSFNSCLINQLNTSDNLASAITDLMKHNEPKLTPKPVGPLRFEGTQFPSEAGPYSKMLIDNSHKFADFFRSVFEATLTDIASMGCSEAKIQLLELELEQCKMTHAKEMADLKSSTGMILNEMKKNFETEKTKLINETRRQCELDRIRAVEDTKKRQWCANCGKEAKFYCCWNTSYCDYPCQQQHWPRHMTLCSQTDDINGGKTDSYGSKAKELTQLQSLSLRHATIAKKSTTIRSNQQLERYHQPTRSNPINKNPQFPAAHVKVINRMNPNNMQMSAYLSNANITLKAIGNVSSSPD